MCEYIIAQGFCVNKHVSCDKKYETHFLLSVSKTGLGNLFQWACKISPKDLFSPEKSDSGCPYIYVSV